MIDTHTHLYYPENEEGIEVLIQRCRERGVVHLVLPNVDEASIPLMKAMHARFPDSTSMAIGLHPTEVKEDWERVMAIMESELESGEYIAVGEVGMDLYWDKTTLEIQQAAFERQIRLAEKYGLPLIIHSRDALEETLQVIEKVKPTVPLIFHSFTGTTENVRRIREVCDPWFGINGVVTYKNAPKLREALSEIGLDRILLETDSPYLSPVPYRGRPNNSSYLTYVRDKVAESLRVAPSEVERATDFNARTIFGI